MADAAKLSLPLTLVVSLAASLVPAIGVAYRVQFQTEAAAERLERLETFRADHERLTSTTLSENALHFQKLDLLFAQVLQRLDSIDAKIDARTRATARRDQP